MQDDISPSDDTPQGDNNPQPQEAPAREGEVTNEAPRLKSQLSVSSEVLAFIPKSLEEAARLASGLIAAGVIPDAYRYTEDEAKAAGNPQLKGSPHHAKVIGGILKSLEVGLAPITGLANIMPVNGRFTVWGDGAQALIQQSGMLERTEVEWIGDQPDEGRAPEFWPASFGCQVRMWRRGQSEPYVGTFTVSDAKRAGLWNNTRKRPWMDYPKRMLFNRARGFPQRDGFADALAGLSIAEEVFDMITGTSGPKPISTSFLGNALPPPEEKPEDIGAQLEEENARTAAKVFGDEA